MSDTPRDTRVGFIGLGVMGKGMARNLMKAGFEVHVFNRSRGAIDTLMAEGARDGGSPAAMARVCGTLMLCLPDTPDVEAVLFGPGGIAVGLSEGTLIIDTSTISATATRTFAERLAARGAALVDSPVSGGPKGAAEGTLSCMVGGADAAVAAATPMLEAIGSKFVHLGPPGAGQLVKACNQLVIASTLMGISEAVAMCRNAGIDPHQMRDALLAGSAQSFVLQNHCKRLLDGALAPGFRSTLMLKDLGLALSAARDLGAFAPTTGLGVQLFTALCNSGRDGLDSAALGLLFQDLSQPPTGTPASCVPAPVPAGA
ncbi:NAD(P)-dependent oxidoreductase [Roseixanthobacter liquoris]|uniref:NAD(P)-dependent oxidoreductase n=1 Tax=Roseixanthobacter liquoris TaxID=3119921 RepID=UPI003728414A